MMQHASDYRRGFDSTKNAAPSNDSLAASTAYLILAGLSAFFVSLWFSPNDTIITILIAVFFVMTLGIRFWSVALIFLMVQVGLFLAEPGSVGGYSSSPGSSLVSIGLLVLLISCCRYLTLTSSPAPYRLSNRSSVQVAFFHATREPRQAFAPFGVLSRDESTVGSAELFTMLGRAVIPVVAISFMLALAPLDPDTPEIARLIPPAVRTITLGIILLAICVLTNSLLSILIWRKLSPAEARIFARSELSKWIHREVSRVSRRRIRFRNSRRH
ncbi:MAG: hypothetical protein O3B68_04910 [Planctomycetota bacterium]|nr:hypothetical protein [Planctomycetota bacterium]